jgi:hypothetical protein
MMLFSWISIVAACLSTAMVHAAQAEKMRVFHDAWWADLAKATSRLIGKDLETKPVQPGGIEVTFIAQLTVGSYQLAPIFKDAAGNEIAAHCAIIKRIP